MTQRSVSKMPLAAQYGALADLLTTTNDFVDAGTLETMLMKTTRFQFSAAANTLSVKILGSLDGGVTYPIVVEAAFNVTVVGSPVVKSVTAYYTNLKVQVEPLVDDSHGTLSTKWAGASF